MIYVNGKKVSKSDYVSKNFKYGEFASKDGAKQNKLSYSAVNKLQDLRDRLDTVIFINSAYRSPRHNQNVGGAKTSRHLQGDAFDIRVPGYTPLEIARFARYLGFTGVSAYSTFTHVDTRPGKFVSWGPNRNRINPVKPPEKPKVIEVPKKDFRFTSDIMIFDMDGKVVEVPGLRRYLANDKNFIQFIALRDLECLGFKVDWKDGVTEITKTGEFRKANLNKRYVTEGVSHALVKLKYNGAEFTLDGHVIYDKHKNASQFIAVKSLKGLGFGVAWDSKRRLVVLS